ncbi:unnamed protein product [Bursaphelenchus okinawaensis]|uniref:Uncharacterized protein n=1 Tax=Bursaphelenchus okinawaensis TaxID=465554 RepID=A0A811K876_9BILA|nr:unnamed protein product [Bursaphelenchus okinawaensis]CAG9093685.1 unnamed protein product [Bursaphelenchus okinawaensis]
MFSSPGAVQFTTTVRKKSLCPAASVDRRTVELDILGALKGDDVPAQLRLEVFSHLDDMEEAELAELVNLLVSPDGLFASAIENDACKIFQCAPDEFEKGLDKHNIVYLLELWSLIKSKVLNNLYMMLQPVESRVPTFIIRREVMKALRNRVLLPLLRSKQRPQNYKRVQPVITNVWHSACDGSPEHKEYQDLVNWFLHTDSPTCSNVPGHHYPE